MIYLTICFLQLVCSKHFLIQTEDTNEDSRETKDFGLRLNYHGGGYNNLRLEHGFDYNEEVNEQQKSTKKIKNEIHKNEKKKKKKEKKKKLKKVLDKAANQAGMPKKKDSGADNHPGDYRYVPPYYPDTYDDSNYDDGSKGLSAYYRALLQRNG